MFSSGLPCNLPFPSCLGIHNDSNDELLPPGNMGSREPVILNVYDMVSIGEGRYGQSVLLVNYTGSGQVIVICISFKRILSK